MQIPAWTMALAPALLAGCWGGPTLVRGVVRELPVRCEPKPTTTAAPIAGATVVLRCPEATAMTLVTDGLGAFRGELPQPVALTCSLHVEKAGFAPRDYPLEDVCTLSHPPGDAPTQCAAVSLVAQLAPATPAATKLGRGAPEAEPPAAPAAAPTGAP